jgi:hypothetical protein
MEELTMKETKSEIMQGVQGVVSAKIIGNNTIEYVNQASERIIRLHHTDILTFRVNGDIALNTGGWKTVTTKARINEFLPSIYWLQTSKGQWFLRKIEKPHNDVKYLFADNMIIKADGTIEGAGEYTKVN